MKLLLTSAGFKNPSIIKAFEDLVGLPKDQIHIAFIPTAANVEVGDKGWLIEDIYRLSQFGYGCVDIVDISALPKEKWQPRLDAANVLFLGGGNTFHLMHWLTKSGLADLLPEYLKTKVYVGISAGSCVTGKTIYNSVQNLFDEQYDLEIKDGVGLVDFQFIPHLNSKYFSKIREENLNNAAKEISDVVYALDDESALQYVDGTVEIISEGKFLIYNTHG
jgi:dipeptidase E